MSKLVNIEIHIENNNIDNEKLDKQVRLLKTELKELDIQFIDILRSGLTPNNTMSAGDALAIGSLVITLAPTIIPAVVEYIKYWTERSKSRVKLRYKDSTKEIEIDIPESFDEQSMRKLINIFNSQ